LRWGLLAGAVRREVADLPPTLGDGKRAPATWCRFPVARARCEEHGACGGDQLDPGPGRVTAPTPRRARQRSDLGDARGLRRSEACTRCVPGSAPPPWRR